MKKRILILLVVLLVLAFVGNAFAGDTVQSCVQPPSGLVSWWPGDGDANDIIDGNDGTLVGGATFDPGRVDQAFSFSASGDMVSIPHNPNLNLESLPSATFDGWFKSSGGSSFGDGLVIGKHTCGVGAGWFFTTDQGCYIGNHYIGGHGVGSLNLDDDQFHHFACVKDGTTYREHIDGVLISQGTGPAVGTPVAEPVQIGSIITGICVAGKHQLFGLIDELELFDRALTPTEIQDIYNAGSAGKCKVTAVAIDIKPGSDPNCFNVNGHGVIPVAILGAADFDVTQINVGTLSFGGLDVRVKGNDNPQCSVEDVSGDFTTPEGAPDTYLDLVCQFMDDPDSWSPVDGIATLTGNLHLAYGGWPIEGSDSICIRPPAE